MKVEFLIVCHPEDVSEDSLRELLQQTLANNLDDKSLEELTDSIRFTHLREIASTNGDTPRVIRAFDLMLPEETTYPDRVIKEFAAAVSDSDEVDHLLKFYDDTLLEKHLTHQRELFDFEMRLRKALSIIYLNSYKESFYELLRDETTKPAGSPTEREMLEAHENEFFHLLFSQYINLNKRRTLNKVEDIVKLVQAADDFDKFKQEVSRAPVEDEADSDFLASLKQRLNPVEQLRNCVAHNRTPLEKVLQDYSLAQKPLDDSITEFLKRFEQNQVPDTPESI
jgi:hypothetical protein